MTMGTIYIRSNKPVVKCESPCIYIKLLQLGSLLVATRDSGRSNFLQVYMNRQKGCSETNLEQTTTRGRGGTFSHPKCGV